MPICSNGHDSTWDDYCSDCGVALDAAAPAKTQEALEPLTCCPNCSAACGTEDVFCENCGYDFISGSLPSSDPTPPSPPRQQLRWSAVVRVDRDFYDRMAFEGQLAFPDSIPAAITVDLPDSDILIGRESERQGRFPEIDMSTLFDESARDPAVSSMHARLSIDANGQPSVTDLGSTNGTFLGDAADPLDAGHQQIVPDDTPIYLGAWTRIDLKVSSEEPDAPSP